MLNLIPSLLVPFALVAAPVTLPRQAHTQAVQPALHMTQRNWRRMPYSGSVLYATAVRHGWIKPRVSRALLRVNPYLKCKKPLPCAFPNVDAAGDTAPANETPIAANPKNKKQLVSGANDYSCNAIEGYYVTSDGGNTWVRSCGQLESGSGDGDPIVGFDLNNAAYRGGIDVFSNGTSGVIVDKSTDGGNTWSAPVTAVTQLYTGGLTDKPWLQIDTDPNSPTANSMYVSVTQFDASNNTEISVSHSTDGGMTWATVPIGQKATYPTLNQFSDIAVGPDGTVYVTWMRCTANGPTSDCGGTVATMLIAHSTDGGNTWSSASTIENVNLSPDSCGAFYGCVPNTDERLSNIPSTDADETNRASKGTLYTIAYNYTGAFCQVLVTKSTNGGATWSSGVAVSPPSDTHDQFFPWLNVSRKKGLVGATWMDRRNDPSNFSYEEFGGISTDGGSTFGNIQIAANPSNPDNDGFGGGFMGDYTGNAWDGKSLYASWTDTTKGTGQDFVGGVKF